MLSLKKSLFHLIAISLFSCFNLSSAGIINSQLANPSANTATQSIVGSWKGVDNDGKELTLDFSNDGKIRLRQEAIDFIGYYRVNDNFINLSVNENFDQLSESWSFQLSGNTLIIKSSDGSAQLTRGSTLSPAVPSNDTFFPDGTYNCRWPGFQKAMEIQYQGLIRIPQISFVFSGNNFQLIMNMAMVYNDINTGFSTNMNIQLISTGKYSISGNMFKSNVQQIRTIPHMDLNAINAGNLGNGFTLGEQPPTKIEYIQGGFAMGDRSASIPAEVQMQMQQYNLTTSDFIMTCTKN